MPPLRLGLVGIDHYHSTGWVESAELLPDLLELVALYDPDPEVRRTKRPRFHDPTLRPDLGRHADLPMYGDLDALIREQRLDVAIVTLPNVLAPDAITRLARAGIHLLTDKPVAVTAADARAAFAVAREAGVRVAVGLTNHFAPGWRTASAMVRDGRLGRLFTTEAIFVTSSVLVRDPTNHLFNRSLNGGGILNWLGVHAIDGLLWVTGDRVVEVHAMAGTVGGEPIDVEDAISVGVRWANGAVGTMHFAYALPRRGYEGYVAFRGSRGSLTIAQNGDLELVGAGDTADPIITERITMTVDDPPGYGAGGKAMLADLVAAIRDERDPVVNDMDMLRTLEVIDAIYEAASTGRRVRLGS